MTVSLFDNQLVLEVPEYTEYLTFLRTEEAIEFCKQFNYRNHYILQESKGYPYISICCNSDTFYNTSYIHDECYDISDIFYDFILQKSKQQTYEYW